ncbi:hypothetical protein, partial [Burkholderia multivorans]|uniref:hypothetical protein n=1 Tax=Burkholderia multivorans TaxID=87883 RepID=UPI001C616533
NSYVNLKIATCLVRYADDRLIDQRFLSRCDAKLERSQEFLLGATRAKLGLLYRIEARWRN